MMSVHCGLKFKTKESSFRVLSVRCEFNMIPTKIAKRILSQIENGDAVTAEDLLPLVYDELRKLAVARLADEPAGQTLQPTALVHEAYVRLVAHDQVQAWDSRGHFFAAAAEAMRRILVDRARRKARSKHGGDLRRVDLDPNCIGFDSRAQQVLKIHDALDRFEREEPAKAQLVKLRYFAGMSLQEAATAMDISRATASRYWTYAKAWLYSDMESAEDA